MKKLTNLLFEEVVENFRNIKDSNNKKLNMISFNVSQGNTYFSYSFKKKDELIDIRSICKTFLCVALGIGIDEGISIKGKKLTLGTKVWEFFENKVNLINKKNISYLEQITLKHLLTHTIGFSKGLMFSKDIKNRDPEKLLDYIFNSDIVFEPGTKYVYSNVGPYLISIMIQDEFGINFSEWTYDKLFSKIDIDNYFWKNYGRYCAGCTGLKIKSEDLHKLGLLFSNNGVYNDYKVVSKGWLDKMRSKQIITPDKYDKTRVFPKYAYGFFIVVCKNGIYYSDGKNGQYLIIIPENNMVISTLADQEDNRPITEAMRPLL